MPNNWKTYKLKEFGNVITGNTPSSKYPEDFGDNIAFVTPSDFSNYHKSITNTKRYLSNIGLKRLKSKFLPIDSIIVTCIGSDMGKVAMNKVPCVTNQQINSIIVNETFNADYLLYSLISKYNYLRLLAGDGTTMPIINKSRFEEIEINLPPKEEQQSIASILSAIDDKIENNLAINKTLEEMAMALYKHWFVDFGPFKDCEFVESELGLIPKGWEVLRLQDVSTLTAGGDKPKNFSNVLNEECQIPIYSNGITNDGLYGYTDNARINEESITVSARGTIGFVCLRLEPYLPIVRLIAVVPKKEIITSKYLFYWLKSQNINGNGTTQQQLTVPDFKDTNVLVPKFEIIKHFTDILNPYYENINSNKIENQILTQLRDTLLPKLISGGVRLKEFRE
jgi:type I restriction enzyme S subunit